VIINLLNKPSLKIQNMVKKMSDSESSDDDLATLLAKAQKQAKSIKLDLDDKDEGFEVAP
jgi:hypothetical protein